MPPQRGIHAAIQSGELPRILTQQVRPQFPKARPDSFGIGRQIERPERTDLPVADHPGVGLDTDDRAVEHRDRLAAAPLISHFVERQLDAERLNAGDLHGCGSCGTVRPSARPGRGIRRTERRVVHRATFVNPRVD